MSTRGNSESEQPIQDILDDDEEDINMAIMLSIQDPRLNNRSIQRASRQQPNVIADVTKISTLTAMGFTEQQAEEALRDASNDVEVAIHSLLNS